MPIFTGPLGDVQKAREDGSIKHRAIQDLKANRVNELVEVFERQVLPGGYDHAADVAELLVAAAGDPKLSVDAAVLDYADAFMDVPLHEDEVRFNCAEVKTPVQRSRGPLCASEPISGTIVLWRVLGFGARPNPLVYSRMASFAVRTAQAMFPSEASTRHPFDRDGPWAWPVCSFT